MSEPSDSQVRLEELFVAQVLFGLTPDEQAEWEALRASSPNRDWSWIAETIAALDSQFGAANEMRLPDELRERIRADALRELTPTVDLARTDAGSINQWRRLPWSVAAVCLLSMLVAFAALWSERRGRAPDDLSLARERLIASASDVIRADWTAGPTPISGVTGDVAWSTQKQQGYLRFQGMQVNDPSVEQYQLWIFDRNQPEQTPVDGGVFDIASSGEIVVPIRSALRVRQPYLFAVTVEKPGGVVVSDRSRLPLLAPVGN